VSRVTGHEQRANGRSKQPPLERGAPHCIIRVQIFEEAGVPTEDRGLVVTMADGSEYRIVIVESRETEANAWGP
jgi:hypothetical protein